MINATLITTKAYHAYVKMDAVDYVTLIHVNISVCVAHRMAARGLIERLRSSASFEWVRSSASFSYIAQPDRCQSVGTVGRANGQRAMLFGWTQDGYGDATDVALDKVSAGIPKGSVRRVWLSSVIWSPSASDC